MTNDDILLINKLLKLSLIILKNAKSYDTNLKTYNNLLSLEKELLNKINPNNINDYLKYLEGISYANILTDYELLVDIEDEDIIKCRLYNQLLYLKKEKIILNYQENYHNIEPIIPIDSKFYLNKVIKEDFINIFIFKLNELINNPKCYKYKDKLIKIKYLTIYLNPNLNIQDNNNYLVLNSKSLSSILNINNYYYKYLNNYLYNEFINNIKPSLISLLLTNNQDYQDDNYILRILINISLIKTYLVFKDDKNINVNLSFHDIINLYNENNTISIAILEHLLNSKHDSNIVISELRGIYEYENSKGL